MRPQKQRKPTWTGSHDQASQRLRDGTVPFLDLKHRTHYCLWVAFFFDGYEGIHSPCQAYLHKGICHFCRHANWAFGLWGPAYP